MSSKAKNLVHSSILGMCNFFITTIAGIFLMPFIIHSLGDRMYGLWIIVGSILGFYGLFDFGLVFAVQRYISRAIGKGDHNEANKFINTSLALYSIVGLSVLFLLVIISILAPLFIKHFAEINLFRKIIIILGINVVIGFPMRVFSGVLISHIRYDLYTSIEIIKTILRTILVIIFLKMGYGILALALITSGLEISGYLIKFIIVKAMFRYIILSKNLIDKALLKPFFKYSSISFLIQIADQFGSKISNFVIVGFMGLNFVTVYAIAASLIRYFMNFISSTVGLMMPVFSQYEGRGDHISIRQKYILLVKISSYLSILIGGTLILFGRIFIERWMGKEYLSAYPLLIILVIPTIFALMQGPAWGLLYGISKHKFYAVVNTVEVITNLILSFIFVRKFGLIGVALGSAIPMMIIRLFIQPSYICKVIELKTYKFYFEIMMPIILKSLFILFAFWLIFKGFIMPTYLSLITLVSCVSLLFSIIVFFIGFNYEERKYFKKVIFT